MSEALYLTDPDGNGLELYRDRTRAEWPMENGEVRMASDPLDLRALIEDGAGAAEPGGPMPAGTTLGHMHLQIADIGQAEAFYHMLVGFDIMQRRHGALFVSAGGYHHHLGLNTWANRGAPRPPANTAGLRLWTLHTSDSAALAALHERLSQASIAVRETSNALVFDDP